MTITRVFGVRLTDDERAIVDHAAKLTNTSSGLWAKAVLLAAATDVNNGNVLTKSLSERDVLTPTATAKQVTTGKVSKSGRQPIPRLPGRESKSDCVHPITRRIGSRCGACGGEVARKR